MIIKKNFDQSNSGIKIFNDITFFNYNIILIISLQQ